MKCRGHLADGRSCLKRLAVVVRGVVTFRTHDGWELIDPRSIKCPRCGTVRAFVGDVPEELGGSSGVYVGGELRGARPAA